MRKVYYLLFLLIIVPSLSLSAQTGTYTENVVDSLVYKKADLVDSSLVGRSVFSLFSAGGKNTGSEVRVHQSQSIMDALNAHVAQNSSKEMTGYRVRIFFDNRQHARGNSEYVLNRFTSAYPGVGAYRSYTNPYFKVTVGDFRTKSEAMALLMKLKPDFPSAFVVKENIQYPVIDSNRPFVTDTVRIVKPSSQISL